MFVRLQVSDVSCCEFKHNQFEDEPNVQWAEHAGARGRSGGAAHGTRGEDGAFGPRETVPSLLPEVGHRPHEERDFSTDC